MVHITYTEFFDVKLVRMVTPPRVGPLMMVVNVGDDKPGKMLKKTMHARLKSAVPNKILKMLLIPLYTLCCSDCRGI